MSGVAERWRVIIVGGHTRSVGKTQLVCDLITALPEVKFVAGKITQYGHGVCARNGSECDCTPDEHVCALDWERGKDPTTDSGRFLAAGARKSFWLRTKQGYLAEGLPLLREALAKSEHEDQSSRNLILESNSLMQFWAPAIYLTVLDPGKRDFKPSARRELDRASAVVLRDEIQGVPAGWDGVSIQLIASKSWFLQREGQALPEECIEFVRRNLRATNARALV
jgi:hypothetical protein